jgi:hypothetical protein
VERYGMTLTIDAREYQKAAEALTKAGYERVAGRTAAYAIRRAINVVRRNVRAELKPHNKTGKMRDRVRTRFLGRGLDLVGGMRSTGVGSNLIVGGVRPHPIASERAMPMWAGKGAWKGGSGAGITGFVRTVEHPGLKADPFVHRGIVRSSGAIQEIVNASSRTMARELAYRMKGRT